jgi:hypothetical protein
MVRPIQTASRRIVTGVGRSGHDPFVGALAARWGASAGEVPVSATIVTHLFAKVTAAVLVADGVAPGARASLSSDAGKRRRLFSPCGKKGDGAVG